MLWGNKDKVKPISKHTRFEALVRPHVKSLYQTAYRFCGNKADAEDLIQDLLLKLYPKYDELVNIENLKAWMSRILYHLYIDTIRQNDRRPDVAADINPDDVLDEQNNHSTPESDLSNSLILKNIQDAMQGLNTDQKTIVVLHDFEEYTLPELAIMLDTPVGTLKSRLHRARMALRKKLQKKDIKEEPFVELERVTR
ncbi:hypothetical protein MNBD_GAMMA22-371 [hydrothermal vent metagenome]|uniref:RNA polymerase ECF-type sigma factor n=1 Tax=hydrothermal vent metagenome TaxID=652676 RepID=A0A3B1AEG1_9ZZZZ